ncbi:MAG TPA: glycosyltransferase family 2 protein [Sphingomicrobium sp.]|nr:glycosyltransferase family 2 protein [Sphingomicrobium sp.]
MLKVSRPAHSRSSRAGAGVSLFGAAANGIHRWRCAKLWVRVQLDAFRLDPFGYLQAVAWRARGLRVRSRNRIAALAGRSPAAYSFWISCREPRLMRFDRARRGLLANTLAVIDCRRGTNGIEATLASLPDEIRPILLRGSYRDVARIDAIGDLGKFFATDELWICPLNVGDRLAPSAASAYAEAIAAHPEQKVIYADDDLLDGRAYRLEPHFKPDWNPELFQHHDFVTGAAMLRVGSEELASVADEGWPEGLVQRVVDRSPTPLHLPFILHHRRTRPEPVLPTNEMPPLAVHPRVSVIIPTRNRADLLRTCLEGLTRTDYRDLEIIVVDNDSDDPESLAYLNQLRTRGITVLRIEGEFNYSALNNAAVEAARGEFLCFLNNDIEIVEPSWLQWLVGHAARPDIGAAGARLLYSDGTLQHAGVYIGIGGGAAHAHRFLKADERGYFDRSRLPQRVSAVTGACLVVSRDKFVAVGGFDEKNFRVAFNDIDLCIKLNERGWQSFYEPRATLIHHESKSRGSDKDKANRGRFADELSALKRIWRTDERRDPFHHPQLSPFCEQFVISI